MCSVCAFPATGTLCARCKSEIGPIDFACVICFSQGEPLRLRRLPCGDVVHPECAPTMDLLGKCTGSCVMRVKLGDGKIAPLQFDVLQLMLQAHRGGEPLWKEDLRDLEDEELFWVLRCAYHNGIGVKKDPVLAEHWFKEAIYQGDPDARYFKALRKRDIAWLKRAAEAGHSKAIVAMVDYCMGRPILGHTRPMDQREAARYVDMGSDPMCVGMRALQTGEEGDLRRARQHFSTDELYCRITTALASIYYARGDFRGALALASTPPRPTADIHVSKGVSYTALGMYDAAVTSFLTAESPDAYVCLAKLMQNGLIPGGDQEVESLMTRAAAYGHPDAGFYFLQYPNVKHVERYVAMLHKAQDESFLVRCAVFFKKNGKPALSEECKCILKHLRDIKKK